MVRHLSGSNSRGWRAALATFVAVGAVAWHIMACVESPMSFSPDGDLAFTVMDPYSVKDTDDPHLIGVHNFRLLVLNRDHQLREIERSDTHMLTGPTFSPDGQHIAYLRLPLITVEDEERIDAFAETRSDLWDQASTGDPSAKWIHVAPEASVTEPPPDGLEGWDTIAVSPLSLSDTRFERGGMTMPFDVVVRDIATGSIADTVSLTLPVGDDEADAVYGAPYVLAVPQFSPDGEWLHFHFSVFAVAVNPWTGEKRLLGVAFNSLLSPDGKTVGAIIPDKDDGMLGLFDADGNRAQFVRLNKASGFGWSWVGNETLAVFQNDGMALDLYSRDGRYLRSIDLPAAVSAMEDEVQDLAVSPDGAYMVVSYGDAVQFLAADGSLLGSWVSDSDDDLMVQPTFTRDSRQIAFKFMTKEETDDASRLGTVAIVFFTPEGREIFRVPVPRGAGDPSPNSPVPATEETRQ